MRGHELFIQRRKDGFRATHAFVHTGPINPADYEIPWDESMEQPRIGLDDDDIPGLIDWRFLVGMTVFVFGDDRRKVAETTEAVLRSGANRVVSHVSGGSILDTSGLMWEAA